MANEGKTKDCSCDVKDFYQALVSFQAKALHYVGEGTNENDRKQRMQRIIDGIHQISQWSHVKVTPVPAGTAASNFDRCPDGLVYCNGDCVPPGLC